MGRGLNPTSNVTDLLRWLNLTEDEEVVADFSDEDVEKEDPPCEEWALVGKVISPSVVHVNTV